MRFKKFVIGILILSLSIGAVSCSCSKGYSGTLVDLLKEIPEGATSIVYWNTEALTSDSELHGLLDKWKADNENQLTSYGIASNKVSHFLRFSENEESVLVVRGDFDLEQVKSELNQMGRDKKDWKYVDVWENTDELNWVAMPGNSIIGGPIDRVKESIEVIKKGESSLYDNQDVQDILNKLPSGILVHIQRYTGDAPHNGLIASGDSFEKKNADILKVKLVYKFNAPEEAGNALEAISNEVDELYDKVDTKQDGRFIIVTAEVETEDLE